MSARAAAAGASRRGGRVRRRARRRADGARCAARCRRRVRAASAARDGGSKALSARSPSPTCRSSASRRSRASFPLILRRIRQTADAIDRGAARRAGDHRQPGLHPPGRAPRAQGGAGDSDHQLCAAVGLGLAAGARAQDARATSTRCWRSCRSSRPPSRGSTARTAPMWAIRSPNGSGPSAERRGGAAAACRSAVGAGAAGKPAKRDQAVSPRSSAPRSRRRATCASVRAGTADACRISPSCRGATAGWAVRPRIVTEAEEKYAAFRLARAALAESGTVTLELALAQVPMVAAYRVAAVGGVAVPAGAARAR